MLQSSEMMPGSITESDGWIENNSGTYVPAAIVFPSTST
jgi:hypothetical protein